MTSVSKNCHRVLWDNRPHCSDNKNTQTEHAPEKNTNRLIRTNFSWINIIHIKYSTFGTVDHTQRNTLKTDKSRSNPTTRGSAQLLENSVLLSLLQNIACVTADILERRLPTCCTQLSDTRSVSDHNNYSNSLNHLEMANFYFKRRLPRRIWYTVYLDFSANEL